ncbi:protein crowded nuclei 4, partial [Tanacetum coccineum]
QVNIEMQRLDEERKAIIMDHEKRDKQWAELNSSIEELKMQQKKLEEQRELLHAEREEILGQTEQLKNVEDAKLGKLEVAANDSSIKKDLSNVSPLSAPFGWLKRRASSYLEQTESNKERKMQKEGDESSTPR